MKLDLKTRAYIYRVLIAIGALAAGYGLIADKFKNGVLDVATGEPVVTPEPPTPEPTNDELLKAIKELTNTLNKQNSLLTDIYRVGA